MPSHALHRGEPAEAPRTEPWSPDSDPWGAAWTMPPAVDETIAHEHVAEEDADEAPPVEEADVGDELDVGVVSAPISSEVWQAAESSPTSSPRSPTQDDSQDDASDFAAAAIAAMALESATDEAPPPAEGDSRETNGASWMPPSRPPPAPRLSAQWETNLPLRRGQSLGLGNGRGAGAGA